MKKCPDCGAVMTASCINVHCESAKIQLENEKKEREKNVKPAPKRPVIRKKTEIPDTTKPVEIPGNVELRRQQSILNFFGHSTGAKTEMDDRIEALSALMDAELVCEPNARNRNQITQYNIPNSRMRHKKIVSRMSGRISQMERFNSTPNAMEKMKEDLAWFEDNIEQLVND